MDSSDKKIDIRQKVLDRVTKGEIKSRSHWIFVLKKLGLESALVATGILVVISLSLMMYYCKVNDVSAIMSFGLPGVWHVLWNMPHELILLSVFLIALFVFLLRQLGKNYKISGLVWGGLFMFTFSACAALMLAFGVNERMEETIADNQIEPLQEYYQMHLHNIQQNNMIGLIHRVNMDDIEIEDLASSTFHFPVQGLATKGMARPSSMVGSKVKLIGEWKDDGSFQAWGMEIMNK